MVKALKSAPVLNRVFILSRWPLNEAKCKAVKPSFAPMLTQFWSYSREQLVKDYIVVITDYTFPLNYGKSTLTLCTAWCKIVNPLF